jgi:predicted enzyme related to lactoylglutathione lyase
MAEGQPASVGTFCWTELMTRDIGAAKKFYADLIGWRTVDENIGGMTYTMLYPPGAKEAVGGMMPMSGPQFEGVPPHWMPYILVNDLDDRAERCTQLGGQVVVPPTDIPGVGRFCVIKDPTGAVVSLYQRR